MIYIIVLIKKNKEGAWGEGGYIASVLDIGVNNISASILWKVLWTVNF